MSLDPTVLERHVDVGPLRGRRRGLTHCLFHGTDRRPSLSVDLDRGLFYCFACGERGGLKRFAELVGEAPAAPRGVPHIQPPRSEWDRAWQAILHRVSSHPRRSWCVTLWQQERATYLKPFALR